LNHLCFKTVAVFCLISSNKAGLSFKVCPYDGIMSFNFPAIQEFQFHPTPVIKSTIIDTAVDAPGEAPNKTDKEPSAVVITVPNSNIPPSFHPFFLLVRVDQLFLIPNLWILHQAHIRVKH
jgi:hypothetical protein